MVILTPMEVAMVTIAEKSAERRAIVPPPPRRDDGWWNGSDDPQSLAVPSWQLGTWIGLGTLTVLFAALSSAYIVRIGGERLAFALPQTVWLSTALLIANSVALVVARRLLERRQRRFIRWLFVSAGIGIAFLAAQAITWQIMAGQGLFLTTNPHSSFFYVLTVVHGAHVLGGLVALGRCMYHVRQRSPLSRMRRALGMTATYWHFVDAVWLWIVALFLWTSL
ncbi:MAG: cytochrome c oxidase subunit 3 [Bacteroidota bacterium]|nr:cytochrome c oxidase subunit 3 [Candidatus Kapabacteria bacterium]MDW8075747.1 cytochrome c oxidase subunit 3 [Bacteroidota bacterium]